METGNNQILKHSKRRRIISLVFYILAVVLLITAFVSLAACHQNVSLQLEQGVPVKGNELAILNLYLSSCIQYFAFGAIMAFCGTVIRNMAPKSELPAENLLPVHSEPQEIDSNLNVEPDDEDDCDFEAWGFQEQEK